MTQLGKLPKGPSRGTVPASRSNLERYRIRRGELRWDWLVEDTHEGTYIGISFATSAEAHACADELNRLGPR